MKPIIISFVLFLLAAVNVFTACENEDDTMPELSDMIATCSISSPENGAEVFMGETITICVKAKIENDSLEDIRYYVDDVCVSNNFLQYFYYWNTSDEELGTHSIKVEAIVDNEIIAYDEISISLVGSGGSVENGEICFVSVPAGFYEMGCFSSVNNCNSDELPVHDVYISDFEISKYEITNQQFADFMNESGIERTGCCKGILYLDIYNADCQITFSGGRFIPKNGKENFPVIFVSWYGARAFCEYHNGRLPTEAEWEYAAGSGGVDFYKYSGSNDFDRVAWCHPNSEGSSHPVGGKSPNRLMIYDMTGNVSEWCNDWYGVEYYVNGHGNNPQGAEMGTQKVMRGGSYRYWDWERDEACKIYSRSFSLPERCIYYCGFRIVRDSR